MAVNTMDANLSFSPVYRFQLALASPIVRRCYELSQIMEESSVKDLQVLFELLVKSVFGFNGQQGWGLRVILKSIQPQEFDTVRIFLAPDGPVMRAAYRLLSDNYLKYEFPICCLPTATQQLLLQGVIPAFYTSKLQPPTPGQLPTSIYLNSFDYFVFHLIYFLVSPQNQKDSPKWANLAESVYPHIIEDFLRYFFPYYGGSVPPAPVLQNESFETPVGRSQPSLSQTMPWTISHNPNQVCNQLGSVKSLFGFKDAPNMQKYSLPKQFLTSAKQPLRDKRLSESWRSETLAQFFMEVWLNHYRVDFSRSKLMKNEKSRSSLFGSSHGSSLEQLSQDGSYQSQNSSFAFTEATVPSHDHVRMVRMLVKHVHYFANSAGDNANSPLYDLKKAIIPHMMQKKLYGFLRHVFDHWPLDASFRTILETWLSYIQPWRYADFGTANVSQDDDLVRKVDHRWKPFVEENLAFYTVIFQQVLPHLLRMDLSAPKNAYMLLRVTKVFSQTNLRNFIKEAEDAMQEPMSRLGSGMSGVSMRSPTSSLLNETRRATSTRQHLFELENTGFVYSRMFGEETLLQVQHLLAVIRQAKDSVIAFLQAEKAHKNKGFLSSLLESLQNIFETDNQDLANDERSPANMRKVEQHLDLAFSHLCTIFNVPPCVNLSAHQMSFDNSNASVQSFGSSFISSQNNLSDVQNGAIRHDISYQGDPDLQPIRSYEVAFLVRLLYQLSTFINNKYGLVIGQLFERRDLLGRICRHYIQAPMVCRTFKKDSSPGSRHSHVLPPRISLRSFANQKVIVCALIVIAFAYVVYGMEPFMILFGLMVCATAYPFLTALFTFFR